MLANGPQYFGNVSGHICFPKIHFSLFEGHIKTVLKTFDFAFIVIFFFNASILLFYPCFRPNLKLWKPVI